MKTYVPIIAGAVSMLSLYGCYSSHTIESTHEIKPVEIKPIHITIDVNLKVDKDLDDFFNDIDKKQSKAAAPAAPVTVQPAAASAALAPVPAAVQPAAPAAVETPKADVPKADTSNADAPKTDASSTASKPAAEQTADSAGCDN